MIPVIVPIREEEMTCPDCGDDAISQVMLVEGLPDQTPFECVGCGWMWNPAIVPGYIIEVE